MLCSQGFVLGSKALAGADKRWGISYVRNGRGWEGYSDAISRKGNQALFMMLRVRIEIQRCQEGEDAHSRWHT